jgi:hypothetical protein
MSLATPTRRRDAMLWNASRLTPNGTRHILWHTHRHTHTKCEVCPILQCLQSVKQKKALNERSYILTVLLRPAVGRWDRFDATGPPRSCCIHVLVIFKNTQCNITQNPRNDFIFKFLHREKISLNKKREIRNEVWFNFFLIKQCLNDCLIKSK